jgi:hypothetical protein
LGFNNADDAGDVCLMRLLPGLLAAMLICGEVSAQIAGEASAVDAPRIAVRVGDLAG